MRVELPCVSNYSAFTLHNDLDKLGGAQNRANHKSQEFINNIVSDYGMSDIFRLAHGNDRVYTHFNETYNTASRLDFFLVDVL